jgi:predicted Rossmann fold nucleotide-binding protein DprA/Smf involved in DNA uptake
VALFCSVECPGSLIIGAHDLAQALRRSEIAVVSGFQSPVEQECFTILLRGPAPVILCPARRIDRITIRPEWRAPIESGRLLLFSIFAEHQRRPTAQLAMERNRLVAALADVVFVAHAAPSSKTAEFCREAWVSGKAMYTLDNPANAELISLGARPVTPVEAPLMFAHPLY